MSPDRIVGLSAQPGEEIENKTGPCQEEKKCTENMQTDSLFC